MSTSTHRRFLDSIWMHWIPGVSIELARAAERPSGVHVRLRTPDGSSVYTAHERVRASDYGDVAIETVVNDKNPEAGWALIPRTDLVLVAWTDSKRVLLLPGRALPRAVEESKGEWRVQFGERARAMSHGYHSTFIPVRTNVLLAAVDRAFGSVECPSCKLSRTWSEVRAGVWPLGCVRCRLDAPGVDWIVPRTGTATP